jgi:hypothetical protein
VYPTTTPNIALTGILERRLDGATERRRARFGTWHGATGARRSGRHRRRVSVSKLMRRPRRTPNRCGDSGPSAALRSRWPLRPSDPGPRSMEASSRRVVQPRAPADVVSRHSPTWGRGVSGQPEDHAASPERRMRRGDPGFSGAHWDPDIVYRLPLTRRLSAGRRTTPSAPSNPRWASATARHTPSWRSALSLANSPHIGSATSWT